LLSLSIVFLPQMLERHDVQLKQTLIADIVSRFSNLAGICLAGVILTGVYNAWLEVGNLGALWETPYGRALIIKLLLLLVLIILGAFNRYISLPLIRWSAGGPLTVRYLLHRLIIASYLARFQGNPPVHCLMRRLRQRVLMEVVLVIGILICTALLLHGVPARHISHGERGHAMSGQR
ncbi:MAG: CopD family protein, partial [Thermodesulfobacteriota bacterium]